MGFVRFVKRDGGDLFIVIDRKYRRCYLSAALRKELKNSIDIYVDIDTRKFGLRHGDMISVCGKRWFSSMRFIEWTGVKRKRKIYMMEDREEGLFVGQCPA